MRTTVTRALRRRGARWPLSGRRRPFPHRRAAGQASSRAGRSAAPQVRRLTADEAVRLALENNLGIQVARIDPQIQDLNVAAGARRLGADVHHRRFSSSSNEQPTNSFLSGAPGDQSPATTGSRATSASSQTLPWGGSYSVGWDSYAVDDQQLFSQLLAAAALDAGAQLSRSRCCATSASTTPASSC